MFVQLYLYDNILNSNTNTFCCRPIKMFSIHCRRYLTYPFTPQNKMRSSLKDKQRGRFEFMYKKVEHLNTLN